MKLLNSLSQRLFGKDRDPREELDELFDEQTTGEGPGPKAAAWARQTLDERGVDRSDEVKAERTLRQARKGLSLLTATWLVRNLGE